MRWLVVTAIVLSGCASRAPIADLRVSEDKAQLYQRDLTECRALADMAASWYHLPSEVRQMVNQCLINRGHSIIGG